MCISKLKRMFFFCVLSFFDILLCTSHFCAFQSWGAWLCSGLLYSFFSFYSVFYIIRCISVLRCIHHAGGFVLRGSGWVQWPCISLHTPHVVCTYSWIAWSDDYSDILLVFATRFPLELKCIDSDIADMRPPSTRSKETIVEWCIVGHMAILLQPGSCSFGERMSLFNPAR